MQPIRYLALALALPLPCEASAQQRNLIAANAFGLAPGSNAVGFRLIEGGDRSRTVTGIDSATRPRPKRIACPALRAGYQTYASREQQVRAVLEQRPSDTNVRSRLEWSGLSRGINPAKILGITPPAGTN